MPIYANEVVRLKARFLADGVLMTPAPPVQFFVKRRSRCATIEGPLEGYETSTGVFETIYTPEYDGRYDFSVLTNDLVVEEGEFTVRKRRVD